MLVLFLLDFVNKFEETATMSNVGHFDPQDPDFQYLAVDRKKLLQEQTQPFDGKKMCWVPDEKEGFVGAEIQSSKGDEITVKTIEKQEVRNLQWH